jgi:hypothetical protein
MASGLMMGDGCTEASATDVERIRPRCQPRHLQHPHRPRRTNRPSGPFAHARVASRCHRRTHASVAKRAIA